jgi:hypothetical protein
MTTRIKDISGKVFGRLTVLRFDKTDDSYRSRWICKCECGTIKSILSTNLLSGDIVSCGCYKKEFNKKERIADLERGTIFGKLTVIERVDDYIYPSKKTRTSVYRCLCECGKEISTLRSRLEAGKVKSCGCTRIKDLSGKRFGSLVAIQIDHMVEHSGAYWLCKCDCGNETIVLGSCLNQLTTISCGCQRESVIASGVKKYLVKEYRAIPEYRLLKNEDTGHWLKCDVYIPDNIFIEIHGGQHYKFIEFFHETMENFKYRKKLDNLKKKFARKNGIYIEVDLRKIKTIEEAIEYIENILRQL